ncbi:hypothetical protein [Plantactinospora sp. B24E8]|uniref:hypothetical protein n=1 Tax=Plantactinospora sp. B24E8 TaxID=3153567 RepID=UPI00325C5515
MSPTEIVLIVLVVLVVAAAVPVIWVASRRRALRSRFGPEYERLVAEQESRAAAERELRERERRHAALTLTPLDAESRERYAADWEEIQARFVDSPGEAVGAADDLVTRLIAERGYPTGAYDERLAHLSVEHARTLDHYREAHDIQLRNARGEADTEQLRQAVVHYRALFAELLGEDPVRQQPAPDAAHQHDGRHDGQHDGRHDGATAGTRPPTAQPRPETPQDVSSR